jgi:hypothetical protein
MVRRRTGHAPWILFALTGRHPDLEVAYHGGSETASRARLKTPGDNLEQNRHQTLHFRPTITASTRHSRISPSVRNSERLRICGQRCPMT